MGHDHTVIAGEHMARISDQYGFCNPETIWSHPRNLRLRQNRKQEILLPGDIVFIPDKHTKSQACGTGRSYTFRIQKNPTKLRLVLKDEDGRLLSDEAYVLAVKGCRYEGKTAASGTLEHEIPIDAETGELILPGRGLSWPLHIGHLNPTHEPATGAVSAPGLRARLNNLCFPVSLDVEKDDAQLAGALARFQQIALERTKADGQPDKETLQKIEKEHGC
jgi:hypothetical protein